MTVGSLRLVSKVNFPNPVIDKIYLENRNGRTLQIELYDLTGKMIKKMILTEKNGEINVQSLEPSMYLLKIINRDENHNILIIKN